MVSTSIIYKFRHFIKIFNSYVSLEVKNTSLLRLILLLVLSSILLFL